MSKRILAAVLWSVTGWCFGAMVGFAFGIGPSLAPILAVAAAILIGVDPLRVLWIRPEAESPLVSEPTAA